MQNIILYLSSIRYLKPSQIIYRIIRKIKSILCFCNDYNKQYFDKDGVSKLNCIDCLDFDESYISRYNAKEILNDEIELLNEKKNVDWKKWKYEDMDHLWNFNLHYFDYLFSLVYEYRKTKNDRYFYKIEEIIENWINENKDIKEDAWHPYTISIRLSNLLFVYSYIANDTKISKDFNNKLIDSMYSQYLYLLNNLEKDLLANHYFENIKTIILCSIFFNDEKRLNKYFILLKKQCKEQILEDGMHYELSFMYHNIIFEDLIRIIYQLKVINKDSNWIYEYLQKMLNVTSSFCLKYRRLPLFNDCGNNVAKSSEALINACNNLFNLKPKKIQLLENAKYYILSNRKGIELIIDGNGISPSYQPGHSHCDCLSFELFMNGEPLFVNSGTYKYQDKRRNYFRSTKAHNTVMVDNVEQSQIWLEHRVGKRIYDVNTKIIDNKFYGEYNTYKNQHISRQIELYDNRMIILDTSNNRENSESYLHIPSKYQINVSDNLAIIDGICEIKPINCEFSIKEGDYSEEFGKIDKCHILIFKWHSDNSQHEYSVNFY